MVQVIHSGDNNVRLNAILEAAQKRFGRYGLEKTTMREIASDLGISKASLYYYFPDKEHIFIKVVEMEQEIFFQMVDDSIRQTDDPEAMLKRFVEIRLNYFKTFFNLSRLRLEEFNHMRHMLEDMLMKFRQKELEVLKIILQKGIDRGIFFAENMHEMAALFLEALRGIRSLFFHNKELMYVEQEGFDELVRKMNDFTGIFIRSLKYKD